MRAAGKKVFRKIAVRRPDRVFACEKRFSDIAKTKASRSQAGKAKEQWALCCWHLSWGRRIDFVPPSSLPHRADMKRPNENIKPNFLLAFLTLPFVISSEITNFVMSH